MKEAVSMTIYLSICLCQAINGHANDTLIISEASIILSSMSVAVWNAVMKRVLLCVMTIVASAIVY
jgi:hypothetical protein